MTSGVTGYNIVILPTKEITEQVINWSRKITKAFPTKFTLDGNIYHPHMTLYQSNFHEDQYSTIISDLHEVAKHTKIFSLIFTDIHPYVDYVFYHAVQTAPLQSLHETMVETLNPLRDPEFSLSPDVLAGFPDHFAYNIKHYGYVLAHTDYLPHITLSRLHSATEAAGGAKTISPKEMSMEVNSFYLTNVDHDGTCTKILEQFSLS